MIPLIQTISSKILVGKQIKTTIAENRTAELWRSFMPRRKEIVNTIGIDLYSVQVYDPSLDFSRFTPEVSFNKWAAVEVTEASTVPDGMELYTMPGGLYATFHYHGDPRAFAEMFRRIFQVWLPSSDYTVDNTRPHFEVMGEKYKNNDPDSEEEIWVPVMLKVEG